MTRIIVYMLDIQYSYEWNEPGYYSKTRSASIEISLTFNP